MLARREQRTLVMKTRRTAPATQTFKVDIYTSAYGSKMPRATLPELPWVNAAENMKNERLRNARLLRLAATVEELSANSLGSWVVVKGDNTVVLEGCDAPGEVEEGLWLLNKAVDAQAK